MKGLYGFLKAILWICGIVLVVIGLYHVMKWLVLVITPELTLISDANDIGQFGDSAGFSNALFSALAFAAVVVTLLVQVFQNNKNERISRRAQFENNLFHMTGMLEDIVSHLEMKSTSMPSFDAKIAISGPDNNPDSPETGNPLVLHISGRRVFKYVYEAMPTDIGRGIKEAVHKDPLIDPKLIRDYFMDGTLDHYFRYLYRILKYIDTSQLIEENNRYDYACILRGQLSCYELLILFFNCLGIDNGKFKYLIEKYSIFNNLRTDFLPTEDLQQYYGLLQQAGVDNVPVCAVAKIYRNTAFRRRNPEAVLESYQKLRKQRFHKQVIEMIEPIKERCKKRRSIMLRHF